MIDQFILTDMICPNCGQKVGDGLMPRYVHDTEDCPNKTFEPLPSHIRQQDLLHLIKFNDADEVKLKVMNGQGVYINTIDEPNVVIIPEHAIEHLKKT